ncbi:hypothetical protein KI387_035072, partial [Taxus chinensis]
RKSQLAAVTQSPVSMHTESSVHLAEAMVDQLKEGLTQDPQAAELVRQIREGRTRKFSIRDGL